MIHIITYYIVYSYFTPGYCVDPVIGYTKVVPEVENTYILHM